jgi:hypothetical protein
LAPGDYFVFTEPLNPAFTGGSGVGPFDFRPTGFPRDYFDENESNSEDPLEKTLIHVKAGETTMGIDLIANEMVNRLDLLGDDEEMLFEFPDGFQFPFFGKIYDEIYVNSDGNMTFEIGDGKPGAARDETRFLEGPPRIAPFFSDMDPSGLSNVVASEGSDWIKFTWDQVPEWAESGEPPPNEFSVTLHASGDIVFDYTEIAATPDPHDEYPEGLLAVVGVSPGGLSEGSSGDLSAGSSEFQMGSSPIYQVFPGSDFDLEGQQVTFLAEAGEKWPLFFPFLRGNSLEFTGYALTNYGEADSAIEVEGLDNSGEQSDYPTNPASEMVASDAQMAKLGREFFKVPLSGVRDGWIRMLSSQPELASFFMFGNGLDGTITKMDGSVAFTEPSQTLYFTRLYHGQAVYPSLAGPKNSVTHLSIVNPNDEPAQIEAKLYWNNGQQRGQTETESIPANGRLYVTPIELFNMVNTEQVSDGFISIETNGPGVLGFALIEVEGDTVIGLNALPPTQATTLYSAQLGHAVNLFTSLKLVNTTDDIIKVKVTLVVQDESIGTRVAEPSIFPKSTFQNDIGSWFGLPLPTDPYVGSIQIEATIPGIVGDVVFGDRNSAVYAAALPLQSELFTLAVNSQVANGSNPSDSSQSQFTGLAFFNPNLADATVIVEVYDRDGKPVGDPAEIVLGPAGRISKTLVQLVEESAGLVRGYIIIRSDLPIVGQELFGNMALDYMAAVPPAIVE